MYNATLPQHTQESKRWFMWIARWATVPKPALSGFVFSFPWYRGGSGPSAYRLSQEADKKTSESLWQGSQRQKLVFHLLKLAGNCILELKVQGRNRFLFWLFIYSFISVSILTYAYWFIWLFLGVFYDKSFLLSCYGHIVSVDCDSRAYDHTGLPIL